MKDKTDNTKSNDAVVLMCHNGLQLGAVCVGLWDGNCAKVLLCWCDRFVCEAVLFY